jgi:hypothetical protein
MNIDDARSYATEAKLIAAIEKRFGTEVRYMVVCNRAGRFTAVFAGSAQLPRICAEWMQGGYAMPLATFGFMVYA